MFNRICYEPPVWWDTIASRFCEEIWTKNPAELLLIRTKAIIFEQFLVFYDQVFHKIRAQLIFLGLIMSTQPGCSKAEGVWLKAK